MKYPVPFTMGDAFTADEDAEALNMIGWCWGAPPDIRFIVGKRVYVDMKDRTARRLPAFMVS